MELPVSFLENMKKLLSPEEFNAYLDSYSEERVYGLRVNTNKLTPEEFEKIDVTSIKLLNEEELKIKSAKLVNKLHIPHDRTRN